MRNTNSLAIALAAATLLAACSTDLPLGTHDGAHSPSAIGGSADVQTLKDKGDAQIVSATGDILPAVNEFRDVLGSLSPNKEGVQGGGRREINWDGVPAGFTNNDLFPGDFFNRVTTSPRGVVFTTDGSGFRIANNGYIDLNAAYTDEFQAFSPAKLFVARGSTITDVHFFVAGSNTPALVTGFGSVFEDVGRAHSTTIEFYGVDGTRLLEIAAPRASDAGGQSFVGAAFGAPVVAWVRITSGDTPIGAADNVKGAGQKQDVVTMDDFIYGEPHPIN